MNVYIAQCMYVLPDACMYFLMHVCITRCIYVLPRLLVVAEGMTVRWVGVGKGVRCW